MLQKMLQNQDSFIKY